MADSRGCDPVLLKKCGELLKELEQQKKSKATGFFSKRKTTWTDETRNKWIADVDAAVSRKHLVELYDLAVQLEQEIKDDQQSEEWKNWKRSYWIAMYMGPSCNGVASNGVDTSPTITHFAKCVIDLECALSDTAQEPSWKEERRSTWLEEAKSLIVPVESVLFALDVLDQIHKCIDDTTVSQWGQNVESACSKLTDYAEALDKVTRDAGIGRLAGGAASIGGGALVLVGLAAAPFTGGFSLLATAGGTALVVVGSITSFTSSMVKYGWDRNKTKEGEKLTKTVCQQAHILSQCLMYYCETMEAFNEYLDTPEGKEVITELKAIERNYSTRTDVVEFTKISVKGGSKAVSLGLGGLKIKEALRIMRVVSIFRPGLAGGFGSELAMMVAAGGIPSISVRGITLFTGVAAGSLLAKSLSAIGGLAGIGFGIWDVVAASKDLKKGNEFAEKFRKLAEDLKSSKTTICDHYKTLTETD